MQDKFLKQVALYYLGSGTDLAKLTLVFPNRRTAMFLRKYMQEAIDEAAASDKTPRLMPRMVTITHFTQQFNKSAIATDAELVLLLYNAYRQVVKDTEYILEFDRFYFWGSIILNDFNDIDANLCNPAELYRNLRGLNGIRANFLTDEQKEVIRYLWGDDAVPPESDSLWQPIHSEESLPKFLLLWEIMWPLYQEFHRLLAAQPVPLAYSGLQSRQAYETISQMGADDFGDRRYAFVGFSVLSAARTLIFEHLRKIGVADFFWDVASPLVSGADSPDSQRSSYRSASRFVMPLARKLTMPADFVLQPVTSTPEIEILSVPSNFGQAKVASQILSGWVREWESESPDGSIPDQKLVDTAVVMADDHLLTPMLYSVPARIRDVNVTMGVSYSATPFAALMSTIIAMHLKARQRHGVFYFFYQDVVEVLSHPHITLILPDQAKALRDEILTKHIYNISAQEIAQRYPQLAFIFTEVADPRDISQVRAYIDTLVGTLYRALSDTLADASGTRYYELKVLEGYMEAVEELCDLLERYRVQMQEGTFLRVIERALSLSETKFVGRPLQGLQLMSIKDTRGLDFDRLILMSMNERVFPSRNYTPSFIPMSLRIGYGLPTQEHEESSMAYQFYRLLSRASKVCLLYDSRTAGLSSGEMSRYLSQLLHLNKELDVRIKTVTLPARKIESEPIVVDKTPRVMEQLRRYLSGGSKRLSASALKTYLSCPLRFYLQYVMGLRQSDDVLEFIDAASYGTVIHRVAQLLYGTFGKGLVDKDTLVAMERQDIERLSLETLNEVYYHHRYDGRLRDIPGEGQIISRIIAQYVRRMLRSEMDQVPYEFVGAEVGEGLTFEWTVNSTYTVNFTMSIDRIDCFPDPDCPGKLALRFIDYKTGSDALSAPSLDRIFTDHTLGGMFQLLLYSYAYAALHGSHPELPSVPDFSGRIHPVIYKFQTIPSDGIQCLKFERKALLNYTDVPGFYERFEQVIDSIFEDRNEHPFCQTDDPDHCKYCPFVHMCGRYADSED